MTCILEQWMKNHMHSANSSLIELTWYQCANFGTAQERSWMAQWFHSIQDGRRIAVCTYLERLFSACLRLPHHLCIMTSSNVPTDSDLDRLLRKLKSALRWSHNFCQYVSVCLVWHQQHLVILKEGHSSSRVRNHPNLNINLWNFVHLPSFGHRMHLISSKRSWVRSFTLPSLSSHLWYHDLVWTSAGVVSHKYGAYCTSSIRVPFLSLPLLTRSHSLAPL